MMFNPYKDLDEYKMGPMVTRNLLAFDDDEKGYTLNKLSAKKGAEGPMHSHPHKQVVYVLEGSGLFSADGNDFDIKAGDVVEIGSNEPHTFLMFYEDTQWLEFFTPQRDDFRPKMA